MEPETNRERRETGNDTENSLETKPEKYKNNKDHDTFSLTNCALFVRQLVIQMVVEGSTWIFCREQHRLD